MNKKSLAVFLSQLKQVKHPKSFLEQYQTDSEVASEILWNAYMNKDIESKTIADFGCGNGIFGIGALVLGAKKVYFIDVDKSSIEILKQNLYSIEGDYEIFDDDIKKFNIKIDTVLQNPPFGVQKEHSDRPFLEKSFELSNKIYTMHKIESKDFIEKMAESNNFKVEHILNISFTIKKSMFFHKKPKYNVDIGCWILKRIN